jgi:hypothetical protein
MLEVGWYIPYRNFFLFQNFIPALINISHIHLPNVVIEWLTLLRVQEVPGSNLGPGDWLSWLSFFVVFSVTPGECRDSTLKLGDDSFLPNPFQFIIIIHLSPYYLRCILLLLTKRRKINYQPTHIRLYFLIFLWRYNLVSILISIPSLSNFHFEHCIERTVSILRAE